MPREIGLAIEWYVQNARTIVPLELIKVSPESEKKVFFRNYLMIL